MATFLNGVPIGMANILAAMRQIQRDLKAARTACFAGAAGSARPGTAVRRTATTTIRRTATTTLVFGLLWP